MNYGDAHDYVNHCIRASIDYVKEAENFKEMLRGITDSLQYANIEDLMLGNVCSKLDYFSSTEDCENFSKGLTNQGLIVLIANYINMFKDLLRDNEIYNRGATYYINSKELFDACNVWLLMIVIISDQVLRKLFREMRNSFTLGISNSYKSFSNTSLILLICYIILITLITFGLWQPFLIYLNKLREKSDKMLAIIPLKFILKMQHTYTFLEERTLRIQGLN